MDCFKEFLEDYEKKEEEKIIKFLKRFKEGKVSADEIYPPKSRFIKLKEPVARASDHISTWSVVPFYGSTIIGLAPFADMKKFDNYCNRMKKGFNSRDIDNLIDLVEDTGRIQITIDYPPVYFANLEFLEPLFRELKPPVTTTLTRAVIKDRKFKEFSIEFETLVSLGFAEFLRKTGRIISGLDTSDSPFGDQVLHDFFIHYAVLKFLDYSDLVEEIEFLMLTNYRQAIDHFNFVSDFITRPILSPLKEIHNYSKKDLTKINELGKDPGIKPQALPFEIGKFILDKLVYYPETLDGCWEIMQHYDNNELYKILNALNEGVKQRKIDIIENKRDNITEILDNVWKETKNIKFKADIARLSVGLVGGLSANLSGIGILAGLGLSGIDKIVGLKMDSIGEKMAKFFSPNYLVTIYDFKKKHNIQR